MRLYPKRLRNIEDLEREKKALLKKSRQLDNEEVLPFAGLFNKKNKDGGKTFNAGALLDLLPLSNPLIGFVLKKAMGAFSKTKSREDIKDTASEKPRKSVISRAAKEFFGGYLKWKAIELSYLGIRHLIKSRKEKNRQGS